MMNGEVLRLNKMSQEIERPQTSWTSTTYFINLFQSKNYEKYYS